MNVNIKESFFENLPVEILIQIFEYLPEVESRNSVRLVCRRWYDILNDNKFAQLEQMACSADSDIVQFIELLEKSTRKYLNLEFFCIEFDKRSIPLWDACGSEIMSLHFIECRLDDDNVAKIFETCVNLSCFTWERDNMLLPERPRRRKWIPAFLQRTKNDLVSGLLPISHSMLKKLAKKKMTLKNVSMLSLLVQHSTTITDSTLPLMFAAFPGVSTLKFYCAHVLENFHAKAENALKESADAVTSYTILDKLISSLDMIVEATVICRKRRAGQCYSAFTCVCPEPIIDYLRSKDIPIDDSVNGINPETILNFCSKRKHLKVIFFEHFNHRRLGLFIFSDVYYEICQSVEIIIQWA